MKLFLIFFIFSGVLCTKNYIGEHTPVKDYAEAFKQLDAEGAVKALTDRNLEVPDFLKKLESAQVKGDPIQSAKNLLGVMDSKKPSSKSSSSSSGKKSSGSGSGSSGSGSSGSSGSGSSGSGSSGSSGSSSSGNKGTAQSIANSLKGMDPAQKAAALGSMVSNQRNEFETAKQAEANEDQLARMQYAPTSTDGTLTDTKTGTTSVSDPLTGLVTTTDPKTGLTKIYNPTTKLTTIINTLTGTATVSDTEPPPIAAIANPIVPKQPITSRHMFNRNSISNANPSSNTVTSKKKAKSKEELEKKAQIQQKADEKIKKVEKDVVPHISNQCSSGGCCDTKTGKFRPVGTPCRASECSGSSTCLGVSGHCPPALPSAYLANGTACTGGHCQSGVCVKDDHKATTKAQIDELRAKKLAEAKKDTTTSEPIMVHGLKMEMQCTTGGCCDLTTGLIKNAGLKCTFSKHECFEAVGICNGYESKCERKAMKDGTQCESGKGTCKDGSCVLNPLSTSEAHTLSNRKNKADSEAIEKAMALAKSKAEEFESAENAARNEELDLNMAELEAKIEKAKERQKRIKETMIQQEQEENKIKLRTMFDHIHKIVKQEHGIAKQSLFPYQTTMTKEEANDKAHSGFNIHDYIQHIAQEDYQYNKETLALANEKLKSNNGTYKRFPWYAAALFGIFVVAVAVIVGIMKISKSGGKSKKVIKDEEYENF